VKVCHPNTLEIAEKCATIQLGAAITSPMKPVKLSNPNAAAYCNSSCSSLSPIPAAPVGQLPDPPTPKPAVAAEAAIQQPKKLDFKRSEQWLPKMLTPAFTERRAFYSELAEAASESALKRYIFNAQDSKTLSLDACVEFGCGTGFAFVGGHLI
jgi:hypothetical protein